MYMIINKKKQDKNDRIRSEIRQRCKRRNSLRSIFDDVDCDVDVLYGASAEEVLEASLAIVDGIRPIGAHNGSNYALPGMDGIADDYLDPLESDEELADFMALSRLMSLS